MSFVSANSSIGSSTNQGNLVIVSLGNLASGASASIDIVAQATAPGAITNVATVTSSSSDPVITNNTLALRSVVTDPAPHLMAAGALMTSESQQPPNGSVDPGEVVTVQLALTNSGQLNTASLIATLLPTGGVTSPSIPQNYGAVLAGGPAVSRAFTFTAGTGPGPVIATVQLTDNAVNLGQVQYVFELPRTTTLANTASVSIPELGAAAVYPTVITVAQVTGLVSRVEVTLSNLSHQFPDDLDVLLVSPSGVHVMLMSDCGGGFTMTNRVLSFSDAASGFLPNASLILPGTYRPTDYELGDRLPPPAPPGMPATQLTAFNGSDPNGVWSLFIVDDSAGDAGVLAGGWSLQLTTVEPVSPAADLAVSGAATPDPGSTGSGVTYTVNVVNRGPNTASAVTLTNTLPPGFAFVSATAPQGTYTNVGSRVVFSLGDVGAGATLPITIVAVPSVPGQSVNEARVSSTSTDLNPADNVASIALFVQSVAAPLLSASFNAANDQFTVTVEGVPGLVYVIESTTNFGTWTGRVTNAAPQSGILKFVESPASAKGAIYYRAYRAP